LFACHELAGEEASPTAFYCQNQAFLACPITTFFLLTCTKWVQAVTKKLEKEELNVTSILAFNPAALCQVNKDVLPSFSCTMSLPLPNAAMENSYENIIESAF
jgi:hypothetical protein